MARPYLGNPKYTIEVLQKYGFVFQKRFGQNFLIDTHVLERIIEASEITKDDFVLEIGPGIGTMTQYLAEAAREVTAVEIDDALIPILKDTLKEWDNVTVLHGDILKTDIRKIADEKNQGVRSRSLQICHITLRHRSLWLIRKPCSSRFDHGNGTERSGRQNADRSWFQGLRGTFTGCTVLCRTKDRCKCTAELLYAAAEGWKCGDPPDETSESAGNNAG